MWWVECELKNHGDPMLSAVAHAYYLSKTAV
jgi:hypothetical protein